MIIKWLRKWCAKKPDSLLRSTLMGFIRPNDAKIGNAKVPDDVEFGEAIISDHKLTMGEYVKKYTRIHIQYVYRVLKPMIWLSELVLGRFLVKDIKEAPYNKPLLIFDTAVEESLKDWYWYYQSDDKIRKNTKWGEFKEPYKFGSHNLIRVLKKIMLTLITADTAYRTFFFMLMFKIAKLVNRNYPEYEKHLIYNGRVFNDVKYFRIHGDLDTNICLPYLDKYVVIDKKFATVVEEIPFENNQGYNPDAINIQMLHNMNSDGFFSEKGLKFYIEILEGNLTCKTKDGEQDKKKSS